MNLPAHLIREFEGSGGGKLAAVARALYDIEGNLGETHVATDGRRLGLYSRRAGGAVVARHFDLAEIHQLGIENDGAFLHLQLRPVDGESVIRLKFSSWDHAPLDQIAALWTKATGREAGGLEGAANETVARKLELTPLVAFCASIHAVMSVDGHLDQGELLVLSRAVHDPEVVNSGIAYVSRHGIDALLPRLDALLTPAQKRCLLANLTAVGMVDGMWRASEQELIERFREALGIPEPENSILADVLLMKYGLGVLAQEENIPPGISELTPVSAFCASLLVMMQSDDSEAPEELEYLTRALPDPDDLNAGRQYLVEHGVDHLLSQLDGRLGPVQKRCLIANLLGLAMVDGELRGLEQDLVERFQTAMNFPAEDYAAIHEALMTKNNLMVFA